MTTSTTQPKHVSCRPLNRLAGGVFAALWLFSILVSGFAMAADQLPGGTMGGARNGSGLPVPRYVSLKSDQVNIRKGPGIDYPISWVFRRAGLPVEVLKEYQGWRQIRDADGGTGWVYGPMLSGRRTAIVLPWKLKSDKNAQTDLRQSGAKSAPALAFVRAGVVANVKGCDGSWCKVAIGDLRGFIEQKKLWGIYPGERVR